MQQKHAREPVAPRNHDRPLDAYFDDMAFLERLSAEQ